jgi:uncharacterized protein
MSRFENIHLVLKVAEVCNLDCKYCYFFFGGDDSHVRDPHYLHHTTVERIGAFLSEGIDALGVSKVDISLHGGEPLMIGKRRFEAMCRILHEHISPKAHLKLVMQTNATLLDDAWLEILSAYDVGIGVSLDGPKYINDRERIDKEGRGSYDDVIKGIDVLRRSQKRGLIPGFAIGCVINPSADAREIYHHFVHELGLGSLGFREPIMDWTTLDDSVVADVTRFYEVLLEEWLNDDNPKVRVNFLSEILGAMMSDIGTSSYSKAIRSRMRSFSIRTNGDLCPDDALPPKDPRFRNTGFNINNCTLKQFFDAEIWKGIDSFLLGLDDSCRRCKWRGICEGGPAEERYAGDLKFASKTVYCETRKSVFSGLYARVGSVTGFETLDRRLIRALGEADSATPERN